MPLVCAELSATDVSTLNRILQEKPVTHLLRKESMDGWVSVSSQSGAAVFHSAAGFTFRRIRESLYATILDEINGVREYVCSALQLENPVMVQAMLNRFVERHGLKMASQIDHVLIEHDGKTLMLVNLPSCVVRDMMAPMGGRMTTGFSGSVRALRNIPTLLKYGDIQGDDEDVFRGVIATEYKKDSYTYVQGFHYALLQEVISRPGLGITLTPVGRWDA
jgi:hypothetical protein